MRHHFRLALLALGFAIVLLPARIAHGQTLDPAFRADIDKLLQATGAAQMGTQMASLVGKQFIEGLKKTQPNIPERAFDVASEALDEVVARAFAGPDNLMDEVALIYARHFTHDEIRELLAFYTSDLGKKTVAQMPAIMREGTAVGRQWAEKHLPDIQSAIEARLRAEGFIK